MQKAKLLGLFLINTFLLIVLFVSLVKPSSVQSALAGHLVISEIQIAGAAAGDDFIELYNPTAVEIELGDFRLVKRTATGSADTSIVAFDSGDVIPAHGFFLWCNSVNLNISLGCDRSTSQTVADNNGVALRQGALDSGAIVDAVAFGTAANGLTEGTNLTAPGANSSVERKANSSSTSESMSVGIDANAGNGEDTNNNSNDFVLRLASQPQNASASAETPSTSPSPSVSASPSASASASPSPSASPSVSPSPSASPSASISPSPSPSPIASPSASPTLSPSPTQTPSPSAAPTTSNKFVCRFEPKTITFGSWEFTFHAISCRFIRS